ncbi:MAG: DUF192 domain-containing protein [Phycisphaerae bacterium]|nr:DUF192 domain-containing protein [Phycisphaerae bacterium]
MIAATVAVFAFSLACAFIGGCDEKAGADVARVRLGGKSFFLEVVADDATRFKGLSGRTHIEPDGGMLFVFPANKVAVQQFVMRDCPIPIDIVYLDGQGRILSWYAMTPEPPRAADEGTPGQHSTDDTPGNRKYEARLKKYSSRFPTTFVIELAGGTLQNLKLAEGDKVDLDVEGLKKRAR